MKLIVSQIFFLFLPFSLFCSVPIVLEAPPEPIKPFHEAPYYLGWDIDFSPFAGGSDLLFAHRSIERIEAFTVARAPLYYTKIPAARFWRLSDLFLVWLPINYFTTVLQHEVFGHGYRVRSIDSSKMNDPTYDFRTPIPYGTGGGETRFYLTSQATTTDLSAVSIAGVESTAILAQLTKFEWLMAGKIDPRQAVLYILSEQDITLYVGSLDPHDNEISGHDMNEYLQALQWTYPNGNLSKQKLKLLSLITWADPFTFYSAYSWLHYFWSGKEGHIPMIKIGSYGYLPNLRMGLSPFGPEFFSEHYLVKDKRPIYAYAKGGSYGGNLFWGLGFFAPKIWEIGLFSIGSRMDGWFQPKLLLQPATVSILDIDFREAPNPDMPLYSNEEQSAKRVGFAATLVFSAKAHDRLGFEVEAGYKSQGFLPGNTLQAFPIARAYLSLVF